MYTRIYLVRYTYINVYMYIYTRDVPTVGARMYVMYQLYSYIVIAAHNLYHYTTI